LLHCNIFTNQAMTDRPAWAQNGTHLSHLA